MDYNNKDALMDLGKQVSKKISAVVIRVRLDISDNKKQNVGDIMQIVKHTRFNEDEMVFIVAQYIGRAMEEFGYISTTKMYQFRQSVKEGDDVPRDI